MTIVGEHPAETQPAEPGAVHSFVAFAKRRKGFLFGLVVVLVTILLAIVGPYVGPYPPERALDGAGLLPPSFNHRWGRMCPAWTFCRACWLRPASI
jgi:ABC-type antimicrobial peptide transport system permease subunit